MAKRITSLRPASRTPPSQRSSLSLRWGATFLPPYVTVRDGVYTHRTDQIYSVGWEKRQSVHILHNHESREAVWNSDRRIRCCEDEVLFSIVRTIGTSHPITQGGFFMLVGSVADDIRLTILLCVMS